MTPLLSWFDPGWSLDRAGELVEAHRRLIPGCDIADHEVGPVRDELQAIVCGIMELCRLPKPTRRKHAPRIRTEPDPSAPGGLAYISEETFSVDSAPDAVRRMTAMSMFAGGLEFEFEDRTELAARLEFCGAAAGPGGDMWWLDEAVDAVAKPPQGFKDAARARWRKGDPGIIECVTRYVTNAPDVTGDAPGVSAAWLSLPMTVVVGVALQRVRARLAAAAAAAEAARKEARHRGVAVVRDVGNLLTRQSPQPELPFDGVCRVPTLDSRVVWQIDAQSKGDVAALGTVAGLRLITGLARIGHAQWQAEEPGYNIVRFPGGLSALTERFAKGAKNMNWWPILEAGKDSRFEFDGVSFGGLWILPTIIRAAPGRQAEVRITLGDVLLPQAVQRFSDKTRHREARRLIPILDQDAPVGSLGYTLHGGVYRAQYGVIGAMVDGAPQIESRGGVLIEEAALARIAHNAGLSKDDLGRVLGPWQEGDKSAPPFLEVVERGAKGAVYKLAPPHDPAWSLIVEGGARRTKGKNSGDKAALTRRSKP